MDFQNTSNTDILPKITNLSHSISEQKRHVEGISRRMDMIIERIEKLEADRCINTASGKDSSTPVPDSVAQATCQKQSSPPAGCTPRDSPSVSPRKFTGVASVNQGGVKEQKCFMEVATDDTNPCSSMSDASSYTAKESDEGAEHGMGEKSKDTTKETTIPPHIGGSEDTKLGSPLEEVQEIQNEPSNTAKGK